MKYLDGQEVKIGDEVDLGGGMKGRVVCLFEEGLFEPEFQQLATDGPTHGAMVVSPEAGLIHFEVGNDDFVLVGRRR